MKFKLTEYLFRDQLNTINEDMPKDCKSIPFVNIFKTDFTNKNATAEKGIYNLNEYVDTLNSFNKDIFKVEGIYLGKNVRASDLKAEIPTLLKLGWKVYKADDKHDPALDRLSEVYVFEKVNTEAITSLDVGDIIVFGDSDKLSYAHSHSEFVGGKIQVISKKPFGLIPLNDVGATFINTMRKGYSDAELETLLLLIYNSSDNNDGFIKIIKEPDAQDTIDIPRSSHNSKKQISRKSIKNYGDIEESLLHETKGRGKIITIYEQINPEEIEYTEDELIKYLKNIEKKFDLTINFPADWINDFVEITGTQADLISFEIVLYYNSLYEALASSSADNLLKGLDVNTILIAINNGLKALNYELVTKEQLINTIKEHFWDYGIIGITGTQHKSRKNITKKSTKDFSDLDEKLK